MYLGCGDFVGFEDLGDAFDNRCHGFDFCGLDCVWILFEEYIVVLIVGGSVMFVIFNDMEKEVRMSVGPDI
jgi:hypothetical protein